MLLMVCLRCSGRKKKIRMPGDQEPSVTCLRQRWKADGQGQFICTVANGRECNGNPSYDKSNTDPASCAFGPKHLAPLLLGCIRNGKLKPADAIVKLKAHCARELSYSFVKRAVNAAKIIAGIASTKGDDTDSVADVPCHIAALNAVGGWKASYETCNAATMEREILEMAKSAHERDENEKKKKCQKNNEPFVATRFDPSVIPTNLDPAREYLLSYSLALDATAPHLWEGSPYPIVSGDFAHCTHHGQPSGTLGSTVGHDANGHLIEMCECLSFGT